MLLQCVGQHNGDRSGGDSGGDDVGGVAERVVFCFAPSEE